MSSDERRPRKEAAGASSEAQKVDCPCPKEKCERHGSCEACGAHHTGGKSRPFCKR